MKDGSELLAGEDLLQERRVADIALDAGEVGVGVGIGYEVDVGAGVALGEEPALEDSAEEA